MGDQHQQPLHPQQQQQPPLVEPKIESIASSTIMMPITESAMISNDNLLPTSFEFDGFDPTLTPWSPLDNIVQQQPQQQDTWMGWSSVSPSSPSITAPPIATTTSCAPSPMSGWSSASLGCSGSCCVCPPQPLAHQPESVVITITPLNNNNNSTTTNRPTISRVVTCHCGQACVCSSCLVHSSNQQQQQQQQLYNTCQQQQPQMLGVLC